MLLYDVDDVPGIDQWAGVKAMALMHTEQVRGINTKQPRDHKGQRLFLSSVALSAKEMAQVIAVTGMWRINSIGNSMCI